MDARQRHARMAKIREAVRQNDIARWIASQLQDIRDLTGRGRSRNPLTPRAQAAFARILGRGAAAARGGPADGKRRGPGVASGVKTPAP